VEIWECYGRQPEGKVRTRKKKSKRTRGGDGGVNLNKKITEGRGIGQGAWGGYQEITGKIFEGNMGGGATGSEPRTVGVGERGKRAVKIKATTGTKD